MEIKYPGSVSARAFKSKWNTNKHRREYIKRSIDFWSSDLLSRTFIQADWNTERL